MAKVLVVDDIEDNIKLLKYDLEDDGYVVVTASNGKQALAVARKELPDVILLDVMMPVMDGIETCKRLKAESTLARIPVIIVSAKDQEQDVIRGLDVGAHDYVSKPIVYSVVAARVRSALRVKEYEDSILALNKALSYEKERAEKSLRARSSFLATISHEIRTPITAIMGLSEMLSMDTVESPFDFKQISRSILTNSRYLLEVINNILDISKAESGELEIETVPCSVFNILEDVRGIVDLKALEKGLVFLVDFAYPFPETVISDPTRIKQFIVNFATNAIKFTARGTITIQICFHKESSEVEFVVTDTGIGMTSDELDKIFVPFQQANRTITRRYGGTGLGMSISKQIIESMKGSIHIKSEKGKGSEFTIRIPVQVHEDCHYVTSHPGNTLSSNSGSPRTFNAKVLLVEDDTLNSRLVSHVLEKSGLTVVAVADGKEAVVRATTEHFDLILMDVHLPQLSGIEATAQIKEHGITTPVVALTASQNRDDLAEFMQIGCLEFIQKPLDRGQLQLCLERCLPAHTHAPPLTLPSDSEISFVAMMEPGLQEVVEEYASRLLSLFHESVTAVKEGDCETARKAARKMAGAGMFGLPKVSLAAKLFEEQVDHKDPEVLQSLLDRLKREIDDAVGLTSNDEVR